MTPRGERYPGPEQHEGHNPTRATMEKRMTAYRGYKVGQTVRLLTTQYAEYRRKVADKGDLVRIICVTPGWCVTRGQSHFFNAVPVAMPDDMPASNRIRCFPDEITKVPSK